MEIYPQDLGRVGYRVMLYLRTLNGPRSLASLPTPAEVSARTPLTRLRRAWMRGSDVPDETAQYAKPAFDMCRASFWRGRPLGFAGALLWAGFATMIAEASCAVALGAPWLREAIYPTWAGLGTGFGLYYGLAKPRRLFRDLHGPLTEAEVGALTDYVRDPLARDFLGVVQMILSLPDMAEPDAAMNLRRALYALGEAIEGLPEQPTRVVRDDPAHLRRVASDLSDEARREADGVVAASLDRRAQSLSRRAQTVSNIALLVRRNQTLREEVSEQVQALHTSVSAFSVGSRQSIDELADLAASIQHVAAEANAIASAHMELEVSIQAGSGLTTGTVGASLQEEPEILRH